MSEVIHEFNLSDLLTDFADRALVIDLIKLLISGIAVSLVGCDDGGGALIGFPATSVNATAMDEALSC